MSNLPYAKFMCSCGLNIGTFYSGKTIKCLRCKIPMKYKIMKNGFDDKEYNSIKICDCI